jgi:hypothetical protein
MQAAEGQRRKNPRLIRTDFRTFSVRFGSRESGALVRGVVGMLFIKGII